MTIKFYATGSMFDRNSGALVCPVNCVGVMGKGLAKQFAARYPRYEQHYRTVCREGRMLPGVVNLWRWGISTKNGLHWEQTNFIFSFPTKRHWKDKSDINMIAMGLGSMLHGINQMGIKTVAIPALGCGLGGLPWSSVKPLLETAETYMPHVFFQCFEPQETAIDVATA